MAELKVGPTDVRVSDVGPVIDAEAKAGLEQHIAALKAAGKLIAETKVPGNLNGHFVAPVAFEISGIDELKKKLRPGAARGALCRAGPGKVVQAINATGFGLTMGSIAATRKPPVASKSWRGSATSLHQPQPDRRGGGRATVRRPRAVRHRSQGRRAELPAAFRQQAHHVGEHHRGGRQRVAAVAGRRRVILRSRAPWRPGHSGFAVADAEGMTAVSGACPERTIRRFSLPDGEIVNVGLFGLV